MEQRCGRLGDGRQWRAGAHLHALARRACMSRSCAQSRDQAEASPATSSRYQINAAPLPATSPTPPLRGGRRGQTLGGSISSSTDAAYNKSVQFADLDGLTMECGTSHRGQRPGRCVSQGGSASDSAGPRPRHQYRLGGGVRPTGSSIAYAVSKAGLIRLPNAWRWRWRPDAGQLRGAGPARRHARPPIFNGIHRAGRGDVAAEKTADKDDCRQVVTLCTEP